MQPRLLEKAITSGMPQWTAKMYSPKVGRDHLGLGSVSSDQILPALVPGINVLTFHPRYHSFYAFLLYEYWLLEVPRSRASWVAFFRPRDFFYSLGAHLCDQPEHGEMRNIVGGLGTGPLAARRQDSYTYSPNYIKSDLGGYGLYYRSVMIELGLIYPGGPGFPYPVDVPSETGKQVALAFREAVAETTYYRHFFAQDAPVVPRTVLVDYIRRGCLCQLQTNTAPDRKLVRECFLHGGASANAGARRNTFRLFLDIVDQTNGHPIGADRFRQVLYLGAADQVAAYTPTIDVVDTYNRWRLYQAREYYAFALNTLWRHLCDWGMENNGDVRPLPLDRLWAHIADALSIDGLAALLELTRAGSGAATDVLDLQRWLCSSVQSDAAGFDLACGPNAPIHEHLLYRLVAERRTDRHVEVGGMFVMLNLISLRFGQPALWQQPEWRISQMGADGRLSVDGFVRHLRRKLSAGPFSLHDFAKWIYSDYVILQHQLVAASKLPENTYRFQREGSRLRFFNLYADAGFLDSRFDAIATTIYELGLSGNLSDTAHPLSDDGRQLLVAGELR